MTFSLFLYFSIEEEIGTSNHALYTNERKRHVQFIYIMKRVKSSFFVAIEICVQYATEEYCKTSSVFDGDILKNERREGNI